MTGISPKLKPVRDSDNEIVGAVYVGQLMISGQVRKLISETHIGSGNFFLYTDQGSVLVHPTLTESANIFEIIPEFKAADGSVDYAYQGEENAACKKRIDDWGVTLAVNMKRRDIVAGLDVAMLRNNLLVGLFVIGGGIIVTAFLVRSINRPLQELAEKAIKVGNGDYTPYLFHPGLTTPSASSPILWG